MSEPDLETEEVIIHSQSSEPQKQLVDRPQNILPVRTIAIIFVSSVSAALVLSILSLIVWSNTTPYDGPLNQHLPIYSGEIHYPRIPPEYWQHRIMMLKAMGLNSLSVYVFWNHHQIERGRFDFETGSRNLTGFLQLAHKHQMKVLIRPGPYVCAEWDFGGLPTRFLNMDIKIRAVDPTYYDEVSLYFIALTENIRPMMWQVGGPIIMLQVENQYGYLTDDPTHTYDLLAMWKSLNISTVYYLEDPARFWDHQYWDGAVVGLSQTSDMLKYPNIDLSGVPIEGSLVFGGEVYSGWFTDWGWGWGRVDPKLFSRKINHLIENGRSFSLYMAVGGTNFGTTAGANGFNLFYQYLPHITSYDYDAPINEQGQPTAKYHMLRQVFKKHLSSGNTLPEIPIAPKAIVVEPVQMQPYANLWANLPQPALQNHTLIHFESEELKMFDQGLVLYQTQLLSTGEYQLDVKIRDFALVFINRQLVQDLTRRYKSRQYLTVQCIKIPCKLSIVVEAMGHVNFGPKQGEDHKGLLDFKIQDYDQPFLWNIYPLPLDKILSDWTDLDVNITTPPLLSIGIVNIPQVGDTYFNMQRFKKGYLWVNGQKLGRFWNVGPQQRLFCPGVYLKEGQNQIIVLDLLESEGQLIDSFMTLQ